MNGKTKTQSAGGVGHKKMAGLWTNPTYDDLRNHEVEIMDSVEYRLVDLLYAMGVEWDFIAGEGMLPYFRVMVAVPQPAIMDKIRQLSNADVSFDLSDVVDHELEVAPTLTHPWGEAWDGGQPVGDEEDVELYYEYAAAREAGEKSFAKRVVLADTVWLGRHDVEALDLPVTYQSYGRSFASWLNWKGE